MNIMNEFISGTELKSVFLIDIINCTYYKKCNGKLSKKCQMNSFSILDIMLITKKKKSLVAAACGLGLDLIQKNQVSQSMYIQIHIKVDRENTASPTITKENLVKDYLDEGV